MRPVANPPNPFASQERVYFDEIPEARLEVYEDHTRQILSKNDSPDLGFSYSVNPYRGCYHACAYCYARPTHEYLSFGAGTDFDRKIVVKPHAAELLREAFDQKKWQGERVVFSGVTDCYQPLEASLRLTRACLEVCRDYRNAAAIITKAPLIERDIDLLLELDRAAAIDVTISIPFFDQARARAIEPFVATPHRRLRTVEKLAQAGLRVGVNVAPIIPGLNDQEMPRVLEAAKAAGAVRAGWVLLRLPGSVKAVFDERVRAALPLRAEHILSRVRDTRGGKLYQAEFGTRGTGDGVYAQQIGTLFDVTCKKLGLDVEEGVPWRADEGLKSTFCRPPKAGQQLGLF